MYSVSKPVNICAKDGKNVFDDYNTKSGCDGGPGYVCNTNQPWVVNDKLAYGFVAGNADGLTEKDLCCACYEITFTSLPNGPSSASGIIGKKMVVQVTNTGADLSNNHFDIQIPGGGVGIFNGCQSQWGAPSDGWGQRYGGVSSRGDCAKLPAELQAGCQFRFDWMKGADNPTMEFRRVQCPDAITKKSGCARTDPYEKTYPVV